MEPKKLMAALNMLSQDNQRLTLENQRLRAESAASVDESGQLRPRKAGRRAAGQGGPGISIE